MKEGIVRGVLVALALVEASPAVAQEQPVAIFHAFDQKFTDVAGFVCALGKQGYSHVQIAPAQKSNPVPDWWGRYQPVRFGTIDGRGSKSQLKKLIDKAHGCGVKVIADVVFNHMADMPKFASLDFPEIRRANFHPPCGINYEDGNRTTEIQCRLGTLPDLDQSKQPVRRAHQRHLSLLLDLKIDGFRFDAAKHMSTEAMQQYIDFVNGQSAGKTWNYLEVIEDQDTKPTDYNGVAAVTDFRLYRALKRAFSFGGDLRALKVAEAIPDSRSVTFGENHDTIRELNPQHAIDPYEDRDDARLATAFVLAREGGTPLVFNEDNVKAPFIPTGVGFRKIIEQRRRAGASVKQSVLGVVDKDTLLVMERGAEGFFVVNKATARFDVPVLDMTLTNLEGCYRELRNNFTVAIEKRPGGKKFVTRWGSPSRGGMEVQGRDALYFIREPFEQCR